MKLLPQAQAEVEAQGRVLDAHVQRRVAETQGPQTEAKPPTQGADLERNTASRMVDATYASNKVGNQMEVSQAPDVKAPQAGSRIDKALEQARQSGHDGPSPDKQPSIDR